MVTCHSSNRRGTFKARCLVRKCLRWFGAQRIEPGSRRAMERGGHKVRGHMGMRMGPRPRLEGTIFQAWPSALRGIGLTLESERRVQIPERGRSGRSLGVCTFQWLGRS